MNPEEIPEIIICTGNDRVKFEMMAQLIDIGVNKEKISFIEKYHRFYDIEVVDVYGFEPSTVTFAKAIKNIAVNKRIANKIHPYNMGLGKDNRKECYECFDGIDECRGVKKVDELFPQMNGSNKNLIELDIRKSSEILGEIMSLHKKDCVLKMDC